MGPGIDALVAGRWRESLIYGLVFLSFEALAVVLQYFGRRRLAVVTTDVALETRLALIEKQSRLPMSYFDRQPVGRILTRLTSDVEGIEGFFGGTLARMLIAVIQMVAVFAGLILVDPRFGISVIATSLPALVFVFAMNGPVRKGLREFKRQSAHVNSLFAEFVSGISVLRSCGIEGWAKGRLGEAVQRQFKSGMKVLYWNSLVRPAGVFLSMLPMAWVIYDGGMRVAAGAMSIGTLAVFLRLAERYSTPVRTITQEIQVIQEALSSGERVHAMLGAEVEPEARRIGAAAGVGVTSSGHAESVRGELAFRGVRLNYDGNRAVLENIDILIKAGERVGIVGRTGSGKTSLVSLIPALYTPAEGQVHVDGVPHDEWDKVALRRQISFSTQDSLLFRGTLRDNLLGFPALDGATDDALLDACERSGLGAVMREDHTGRFDHGLDSAVYSNGENFSAGEKQLIALTRAIVRKPRILILDEATASIDQVIEERALKALDSCMGGCTCLIIAHKLKTLAFCDRILVLDEGRLVADFPGGSEVEIRARLESLRES
jgi:ABC-type multidrug transport system fused ATPase/permease subunit